MKKPVVVIGIGEIGSVIARGCMKLGHPVFPVTRDTNITEMSELVPTPECVVVAVGEKDLQSTLENIPAVWRDRLVLIQNELLPADWEKQALGNPTVVSVWFEKKAGQDSIVVVPSIARGPASEFLQQALASLNIPVTQVGSDDQLLFELVRKNLYILTTNISGLKTGGTVSELWQQHESLARDVASDVLDIQEALTDTVFDRDALITAMLTAFDGDPNHKCMGRSAPARLERAIGIADQFKLDVPTLRQIAAEQ